MALPSLSEPAAEAPPPADAAGVTPLMAQYWAVRRAHPDALLFYRMGDFYELFFEDAVAAAAALDIALTKRGKHEGKDIAMCGVPVHAADAYLNRLIRKGFKVAICEQVEDPAAARKRGAKAVVERAVVRIVTPGTLTEETLLDARAANYLAAIAEAGGALGLAWLDISTGEFRLQPAEAAGLPAALARLEPRELLVPERLLQAPALFELWRDWKAVLAPLPSARFDSEGGRRRLESLYGVAALDGFGSFSRAELAAAGVLVDYVQVTQQGKLPRLAPPRRLASGAVMEIDAATRRNLELARSLTGERAGSLLATIDRTVTGAGARLLGTWLAAPLTDPDAIARRQDMVGFLVSQERLREGLRQDLARVPDIERALSRLGLGRGGPRDLAALRDGLAAAAGAAALLAADGLGPPPAGLTAARTALLHHDALVERLARALAPEVPLAKADGGFIAAGYHAELDELRLLRDDSRKLILALEARYREATGIASLKIRHNNVLGYYVETTPVHADRLLKGEATQTFIHRQTLAGAVRFTTLELGELERRVSGAADKALAVELALFEDLVGEVTRRGEAVAGAAAALALIDLAAALAELAVAERWCRPVVEEGTAFSISSGRHPVVEAALARTQEGRFVANDCALGPERRLWLVTGPNMAGKSTFLQAERADRHPGAGRLLRPGRGGAHRHRRPAVQPGRRRRRPGAGPLHLHGRDGRDRRHPQPGDAALAGHPRRDRPRHRHLRRPLDRLGHGRAPARGQSLPGAVRHPLSRADRALRQAAGAGAARAPRQGMAGRDRLPARGRAGRRRPLLRHPRRQAGGIAAGGDRARRGRAGRPRAGRARRGAGPPRRRSAPLRRRRGTAAAGRLGALPRRAAARRDQPRRAHAEAGARAALRAAGDAAVGKLRCKSSLAAERDFKPAPLGRNMAD
jgi:DNA mismatch repair protein MutS